MGWDHDQLLDTGIDYQNHYCFAIWTGLTRIIEIWDQTIQTEEHTGALLNGIYGRNDQCST